MKRRAMELAFLAITTTVLTASSANADTNYLSEHQAKVATGISSFGIATILIVTFVYACKLRDMDKAYVKEFFSRWIIFASFILFSLILILRFSN
jgi:hypothetical protein